MRDMSDRIRHHRAACAPGQGGLVSRRDPELCASAWYASKSTLVYRLSTDVEPPGFLFYCAFVAVFSVLMIYKVAPKYGRKNPLIYLSICSTTGSVSIMAIKAFGVALKMTFAGNNQFTHPSTYVFVILIVGCILTQMNYFNKALSQFSTNMYSHSNILESAPVLTEKQC